MTQMPSPPGCAPGFTHAFFTQYKTTCFSAISGHCLAALPAKDVCIQQLYALSTFYNYLN